MTDLAQVELTDETAVGECVAHDAGESPAPTTDSDVSGQLPATVAVRRQGRRNLYWRVGGAAAAFLLGICAIVTWQAINKDNTITNLAAGTQTSRDAQSPGLVTFTDAETRLRLNFPASWTTRVAGTADIRLIAGPGNGDLMSVRVVTLDTGSAGAPTPTSLKPYLDTVVNEPGVTILQENQIVMDHIPGWYYVYTFSNGSKGELGIHAQYFMIRGSQLYSIVFQALPESNFKSLAPTYQKVANSIRFY